MKKLNIYFLLALAVLLGVLVFKIMTPFLTTLLLAFILWQLFRPVYDVMRKWVKAPSLASFLTCLLVFLVIVLPFLAVGSAVSKEVINIYGEITDTESQENILTSTKNYLVSLGVPKDKIKEWLNQIDLETTIQKSVAITAGLAQQAYQKISNFFLLLFVMFFILYYFFMDGDRFVKYAFHVSPLRDKDERVLLERFMSMSRATLKGTLVVAVIQGIIGGLTFWILGIKAAVLWGVLMTLFAFIPLIGTAVIWLPAAIILIITGSWIEGLVLLIIGGTVISSIDNILRPKLVGKDTAIHPLWIFLGTLGGIGMFGIVGLLVGPLVITLFAAILEIFERKFKIDLNNFNHEK